MDRVELAGVLPQGFEEPLLLTSVRMNQASLVGARLADSRLVDVTLSSSDLSGVDLQGASFTRVEFRDVRLSGAQLAQTRWRDTRLVDCRLEAANVAMSVGERVRFERCQMEEVEFHSANLEGVAWWDCDLTNAEFSQVAVSRAQLHGSTLDRLRGASALAPIGIDAEQFQRSLTSFSTQQALWSANETRPETRRFLRTSANTELCRSASRQPACGQWRHARRR